MYELADPTAEADLGAAAQRGVDVRVLLDRRHEQDANRSAYRYLAAHGVHVRWAPASVLFHQKTLTVDDATSVIMTLNLQSPLLRGHQGFRGDRHQPRRRRGHRHDVQRRLRRPPVTPPGGADLVWSPVTAQASVLAVINGARHTLAVENEEMNDTAVTSALAAAARRGVDVRIIMTADSEWDAAFTRLARAGVHVRLYPDDSSALYIHAKVIVADAGRPARRVLIGSQNFSVASLDYNRELGILTSSRVVIAAVNATLVRDFAGGTPYRPVRRSQLPPGAGRPQASTTPVTTRTTSTCTPTSQIRPRRRALTATRTPTGPTAPATR